MDREVSFHVPLSASINASSCWISAFTAASKVECVENEDELPALSEENNVSKISELATEFLCTNEGKKRKTIGATEGKQKKLKNSDLGKSFPHETQEDEIKKRKTESVKHVKENMLENSDQGQFFPYKTQEDDHCETPIEAYRHIVSILSFLFPDNSVRVYDPYYCDGSVKESLLKLGFSNVYNKKKDCYKRWLKCKVPNHAVLVTNPPYSDDHIEKLITFAVSNKKPFFLLLPVYVHKKPFYMTLTRDLRPVYIFPKKRYVYAPPKNFRAKKKSGTHVKSSPFVSMWYCWGGESNHHHMRDWILTKGVEGCEVAVSKSALRDLRRKYKSKVTN